ncbi:apolipoprotein A-II-like [Dryobates pubescens]|uniref:apolipoprotein A-II-like n=1 Tax=Dryobates pubescens TaxID=118200 RepID=UPI0023BA054F|nr:apolipoprotein A-II-like [Dryobates pubescens]
MKVVVASLLLLCACCVQAAMVRREASEPEAAPAAEDFFSRHFQSLSDFMTKDLPQRLQVEELRSQAETYVDRANKQLAPLVQEVQSNFLGLFSSLLKLGKDEGKP